MGPDEQGFVGRLKAYVETCWYDMEVTLCFAGVCVFFVTYGILQEQIMTQDYPVGGRFPSSIALVLANRSLALVLMPLVLLWKREAVFWTGFYWCAVPAVTLVISSWCQHESLRYVSFPTQVVFKSSKIIPTMALGWIILGKVYGWRDYGLALVVTGAVVCFSLSMESLHTSKGAQDTMSIGVAMMCLFLVCDALTSNSEKKVYTTYSGVGPMQMTFAVAVFSWFYSAVCVQQTLGFSALATFLVDNPTCMAHVAGLSVTACCGQVLIFYIVKAHGPVVFSIMMTARQLISVVVSAFIFKHHIGVSGCLSAMVVLAVVIAQSYMNYTQQTEERATVKLCNDPPGSSAVDNADRSGGRHVRACSKSGYGAASCDGNRHKSPV